MKFYVCILGVLAVATPFLVWGQDSEVSANIQVQSPTTDELLAKVLACNAKGRFYTPAALGTDVDGCSAPKIDMTLINNILTCGNAGMIYSQQTNTCTSGTSKRWVDAGQPDYERVLPRDYRTRYPTSFHIRAAQLMGYLTVCDGMRGVPGRTCAVAMDKCFRDTSIQQEVSQTALPAGSGRNANNPASQVPLQLQHSVNLYSCE